MAEWEHLRVWQDPPGPFRKAFVGEQEVLTTLEETVRDLLKKGWVMIVPDWCYFGSLQTGVANIEELGYWDRILEVQLKRKKEDRK